MGKRIEVVGAVLTQGSKVLAARRGPNTSLPGKWEFPGGKIEAGESAESALRRELKEELLCDATIGAHVETTEHEYEFGVVVLATFYCLLSRGEPRLTEHSDIRWIESSDLLQLDWAPADIPTVEKVMRDLRQ